jgi:prolyl-tRNA synthetase
MMVEADSGAIGGKDSHEFIVITQEGEDQVIYCQSCGYAANLERARSIKPQASSDVDLLPVEEVSTPGQKTIEEVASFLGVGPEQTLKAVFYVADGQVVFVTIRGDLEVNEVKLKNAVGCTELRLATEGEVTAAGLVAGSASLVGVKGLRRVSDDSITLGHNFVAGANKPDTHLRNVNYPRDFSVDLVVDIALAQPGQSCSRCGQKLVATRGIEAGHIFKLGTAFSQTLGATFLDKQGVTRPLMMGCYGIGIGRLLAAIVERHHDEKGIVWPPSVAPYHIHICSLSGAEAAAEQLYLELTTEGLEVLLDDRDESAGVKFNDADLLGLPVRITLSRRTIKSNSAEVKPRSTTEAELWPIEGITARLKDLIHSQQQEKI